MKTKNTLSFAVISAFKTITQAYYDSKEESLKEADRNLMDLKAMDEEAWEILNEFSYALWAGPGIDTLSKPHRLMILDIKDIDNHDIDAMRTKIKKLPFELRPAFMATVNSLNSNGFIN